MGKLKRLSSEIVGLLYLEGMTFNQILREMEGEKKEAIINTIDLLVYDGILRKESSKYYVTEKAQSIFGCWE